MKGKARSPGRPSGVVSRLPQLRKGKFLTSWILVLKKAAICPADPAFMHSRLEGELFLPNTEAHIHGKGVAARSVGHPT